MPKKPTAKTSSLRHMIGAAIALAKRNPLSAVAAAVAIFAGIPGAMAGVSYLRSEAESWTPVFRPDVLVLRDGKPVHVVLVAQRHDVDIDYLVLKDQRKALNDAREDLKRDPLSTTAPREIEMLKRSIEERQKRLDAATKK